MLFVFFIILWKFCAFFVVIYIYIYIYVEIERARLRKIKEDQGLIAEAADLMQEQVAVSIFFSKFPQKVETFGAMAKTEKIAFIIVLLIRVGESTIEGRKGVPRPMELRISW